MSKQSYIEVLAREVEERGHKTLNLPKNGVVIGGDRLKINLAVI